MSDTLDPGIRPGVEGEGGEPFIPEAALVDSVDTATPDTSEAPAPEAARAATATVVEAPEEAPEAHTPWYKKRVNQVLLAGGTAVGVVVAVVSLSGSSDSEPGEEGSVAAPIEASSNGVEDQPTDDGAVVDVDTEQGTVTVAPEAVEETSGFTPELVVPLAERADDNMPRLLVGDDPGVLTLYAQFNLEQTIRRNDSDYMRVMGVTEDSPGNLEVLYDLTDGWGSSESYATDQHSYVLTYQETLSQTDTRVEVAASEQITVFPYRNVDGSPETSDSDAVIVFERGSADEAWVIADMYRPVIRDSIGSLGEQDLAYDE